MKTKFLKTPLLLFLLTLILCSCASIFSSSTYPVDIRTEPKGATVIISNKKGNEIFKGVSPANVTLKAGAGFFTKAEYSVKISAPGYDEKVLPITFKIDGWYWGNLLIGGVLGMLIVDPATGAMWKIADPIINETLIRNSQSTTLNPTLQIVDIANIKDSFKNKLVQIK